MGRIVVYYVQFGTHHANIEDTMIHHQPATDLNFMYNLEEGDLVEVTFGPNKGRQGRVVVLHPASRPLPVVVEFRNKESISFDYSWLKWVEGQF